MLDHHRQDFCPAWQNRAGTCHIELPGTGEVWALSGRDLPWYCYGNNRNRAEKCHRVRARPLDHYATSSDSARQSVWRLNLKGVGRVRPRSFLVRQAAAQLRTVYEREGKAEQFDRLHRFLAADPGPGEYREFARQLSWSEGSLRVAVCRLRRRYREIIRAEIAQTVSSPDGVDQEVRYLLKALAG